MRRSVSFLDSSGHLIRIVSCDSELSARYYTVPRDYFGQRLGQQQQQQQHATWLDNSSKTNIGSTSIAMALCNINMQHVWRSPRLARPRACSAIRANATASNQPQDGTTCLITGANTGIGLQTALATARSGYSTVLACRDQAKAEAAKATIKCATMVGWLLNHYHYFGA